MVQEQTRTSRTSDEDWFRYFPPNEQRDARSGDEQDSDQINGQKNSQGRCVAPATPAWARSEERRHCSAIFRYTQSPSLQKTSQRVVIEITDAAYIDWVSL
jgi:hypothetical protein